MTEAADATITREAPKGVAEQFRRALVAPIKAFRVTYLPLLMVYFATGAMTLILVAQNFFERKGLTMTPAELAQLAVWATLPWAIKMVFGELVDTVAVLGSRRRAYVFLGALLVAGSLLLFAAAASPAPIAKPDTLYIAASILSVIGIVLQDVVADAMTTEVVPRTLADGTPRPQADIDYDLGMVQALGRLALYAGILATARLGGWLALTLPYHQVFLIALIVPAISVTGALLVRLEASEARPTDWRILGGGLAFGAVVVALGLARVPYAQEIVFVISMVVIVAMLARVTREVPDDVRRKIFYAALVIFAFRAVPTSGVGFNWFQIDRLGFDEAFFGRLDEIGALLGLAAAWFLSDAVNRQPIARLLLWLTILTLVLATPTLMLVHGWHLWSEQAIGLDARGIAFFNAAAQSPLLQASMIPLLALTAIYAPPSHRATWFALMASFMNLALVAGQLQTKYLNLYFGVDRGAYGGLPSFIHAVIAIGFIVPMIAILAVGRRVR